MESETIPQVLININVSFCVSMCVSGVCKV